MPRITRHLKAQQWKHPHDYAGEYETERLRKPGQRVSMLSAEEDAKAMAADDQPPSVGPQAHMLAEASTHIAS